jgi:hypothetical protein
VKRGQAGLEFVFAYGWAILIFLISTSSLTYMVMNINTCPVEFQFTNNLFVVKDHKFMGDDAVFPEIRNLFYVVVQNNLPERVKVTGINIRKGEVLCGSINSVGELFLDQGDVSSIFQGNLTDSSCWGGTGDCYNLEVEILYEKTNVGLGHVASGTVAGSFEALTDRWTTGGWSSTNFSYPSIDNNSVVNERFGEKINYCINETPSSNLVYRNFGDLIYWDLPLDCDHPGISGIGFENACGPDKIDDNMAKGWIHTSLHIDPIFSEHEVYLEGNAIYWDVTLGKNVTNGICMNDNLYFYVNGILKYWGGTTGVMIGEHHTYELGDEVIDECGNCALIDTSKWCIPAFKLTTSGFNFGEENDIDILVEDYCKGGDHAGGMSRLRISMV